MYAALVQEFNVGDFLAKDIDFQELADIFTELQTFDRKSDVWRYLIDKTTHCFLLTISIQITSI